jgi:hypothetical protein
MVLIVRLSSSTTLNFPCVAVRVLHISHFLESLFFEDARYQCDQSTYIDILSFKRHRCGPPIKDPEDQPTTSHISSVAMAILSQNQHSSTVKTISQSNQIISTLYPALIRSLNFALFFQRLLSTTTFFLCVRISIFTLYTTKVLLLNAFYASKLLVLSLFIASRVVAWRLACTLWKGTEKLRRKLFFEFVVWILNPNAVILFIFWPGWIVLGGIYLACRSIP